MGLRRVYMGLTEVQGDASCMASCKAYVGVPQLNAVIVGTFEIAFGGQS